MRNDSKAFSVVKRLLAAGAALLMGLVSAAQGCLAADTWGGSVSVTNNYLVRGISRSNDQAALQIDLHYMKTSGLFAGLFASNSQIVPQAPRDVELNAFLGFAWSPGDDWRNRILASHYAYPWNHAGAKYNYDEVELTIGYQDWLDVGLTYSPNAPYFLRYGHGYELRSAAAESAEINLQRSVLGKLAGTAGVGYDHLGGPDAVGYGYWSVGFNYDLAPLSLAVAYVGTTAEPKALFYKGSGGGRWTGTVIWRF